MKKYAILLVVALSFVPIFAQKIRIRSQFTPTCGSGGQKFADVHADGNIAVLGTFSCRGAFIFDISNPDAPVLASHYNPSPNQQFLEAIVIGNRGYFGSGTGGEGVHIVDLTDPGSPQLLGKVNSSTGSFFNSIHEMVVFDQAGKRYLVENINTTANRLLKIIDVTNPAAPVLVHDLTPTEIQWVHAMHVRGDRLFTSGWGNSTNRARTEIYSIANLATTPPALLGFIEDTSSITAGNSMHSSWTSEDGNYLYSAREIGGSAANGPNPGDIRVYNITNPAQPLLVRKISMNELGLNAVTPHNPAVHGNKLYVSWYQAGVQVFDIGTDPAQPKHIGQYDTYQPQFAETEADREFFDRLQPWDIVCATTEFQNSVPTNFAGNWAVFPFLGEDKVIASDLAAGLIILDVRGLNSPSKNAVADFDGDRRTDLSVFAPQTGSWMLEPSSAGSQVFVSWGLNGDVITPGDYDGDGRTDTAVFRPSAGRWYIAMSSGVIREADWGLNGDVPVPGDYDADGKTDLVVWRPSDGNWYINQSLLGVRIQGWGLTGDKVATGDFEGDGKSDLMVWRPSNGNWYVLQSSSSIPIIAQWGLNGDIPVVADFDGNGRSEFTVFRPSNATWYRLDPFTGSIAVQTFGLTGDVPLPADYDGDGIADVAVFRPSNSTWYQIASTSLAYGFRTFGGAGDVPVPAANQPR